MGKCGMGAAAHNENDIVDECTTVIGNQVVAVGQLALSVATLGASMVATKASASSTNAGAFATLKKKYDEMVSLYETLKRNPATKLQAAEDAYPIGSKVWGVKTAANTALDIFSEADIARLAAQIAAIADPSGVAGAAAAFSYDKCSKRFPEEKYPEQYAQWVRLRTERSTDLLAVAGPYSGAPADNVVWLGDTFPEDQKTQEKLRYESWRVEPQDDGTVLLKAAILGPGMCLGVSPEPPAQNQPQVQPCSDDPSGQPWKGQHWKLKQDGDWTQLKTVFSGDDKCLGLFVGGLPAKPHYWPVLQKCGANPQYPNQVAGQHWKITQSPYKGAGAGGWTP